MLAALVLVAFFIKPNFLNTSWKSAASSHFSFTISHPPTWAQSEDPSLFYLVNTKSTGEFRAYITVSTLNPFGPNQDVKNTFDKIYNAPDNSEVSSPYQKTQETQSSEIKNKNAVVDNQPAVLISQDTIMPGPYYSQNIYVLKGDQVWIIRLIASTKEELLNNQQIFEQTVSTFKFAN